MKRSISSDSADDLSANEENQNRVDSHGASLNRESLTFAGMMADLNDLSGPTVGFSTQEISTPKTILRSQQSQFLANSVGKSVTIHSQPEIIQLRSNSPSLTGLSNPCYFAPFNDSKDQYDIEQQVDNRVVISIRGLQNSASANSVNNNNNNNSEDENNQATQF